MHSQPCESFTTELLQVVVQAKRNLRIACITVKRHKESVGARTL